jgi:hypothetical protein
MAHHHRAVSGPGCAVRGQVHDRARCPDAGRTIHADTYGGLRVAVVHAGRGEIDAAARSFVDHGTFDKYRRPGKPPYVPVPGLDQAGRMVGGVFDTHGLGIESSTAAPAAARERVSCRGRGHDDRLPQPGCGFHERGCAENTPSAVLPERLDETTVNGEVSACDVGGAVAREHQDQVGDLVGADEATGGEATEVVDGSVHGFLGSMPMAAAMVSAMPRDPSTVRRSPDRARC